jgi:hypothetical protein
MAIFEYTTRLITKTRDPKDTRGLVQESDMLIDMGRHGWELACIVPAGQGLVIDCRGVDDRHKFYFKRRMD